MQSGLYRFIPEKNEFQGIVEVEPDLPGNRLNDGAVDPSGRLWFGTMDNDERAATGAFYCFDRGALKRTNLTGIAITNGPAISPDGRTLYWVDTLGGTISACEIGDDGELGPSRLVVKIPPKEGHPDGPTIDSEGCIWISLYAGGEARRYSPAGELLTTVRFPVANITKIAFGGPGLRTAFATTARHLLKPDALERAAARRRLVPVRCRCPRASRVRSFAGSDAKEERHLNPLYEQMQTSVFERMSALAAKYGAVNLGQGFPDFGWPDEILDAAARAVKEGSNQYAPSRGLPALREAVASHYHRHQGLDLTADHVCVTSGATEALGAAILASVAPGDEVIIFTPGLRQLRADDPPRRRDAARDGAPAARLADRARRPDGGGHGPRPAPSSSTTRTIPPGACSTPTSWRPSPPSPASTT